jgi:hypothetical protein
LAERRVHLLYEALTGERLGTGSGLWQQYVIHVKKRRHKAVHAGEPVSREEAAHSYETAQKVIDYLRQK